jgi:exoribonuclease R
MIGRLVLSDRNIYKLKSGDKHYSARKCHILSEFHNDILIKSSKDFNPKDEYVKINLESNTVTQGLGNIGNEQSDIDIYHHLHMLDWMSKSNYNKLWEQIDTSYDLATNSILTSRIDYTNQVITIDPLGSIDLDDGFSFSYDNDYYYLDIHIADPMSLFNPNESIWIDILKELETRVQTCYIGTNPTHLLPEKIVKQVSLLEDKSIYPSRRAISFCFKISKYSNDINFNLKFTNLMNIKNYTYEDYDDKINLTLDLKYNLITVSNKLIEIMGISIEPIHMDSNINISHRIIEIFMITTNWYGGNYLVKNNYNNTIIRVQCPTNFPNDFDITQVPIYARPMLSYSANYISISELNFDIETELEMIETSIKSNDNINSNTCTNNIDKVFNKNNRHYTLGISNYAHMSSPMRRYIDMINHLGLYQIHLNDYLKDSKITDNIDKINKKIKNYKKLSNAYDLINHIKKLYPIEKNKNCKFKACLFDWTISKSTNKNSINSNKINCLLVLNQSENNFTKMVNVELPQIELTQELKKYMEFNVELYYNSNNFKSNKFPFSIKII